ncbi:hypothetical protein [Brucella inopinata]|uniref:Pam3-gp28 family putative phage holin n=2 Tax=Brucella/Ochrobactrum group TaxID=2826938 RepID=UPI000870F24D|nr:hypothetical protein [Brucella inopinata]SCD22809.1 putative membrane protein [Brucella inopinata]
MSKVSHALLRQKDAAKIIIAQLREAGMDDEEILLAASNVRVLGQPVCDRSHVLWKGQVMDIALLIPIIRQILQVVGGVLITRGWLDDGSAEALIGIIVNGITFGWWMFDRYRINKRNRDLRQTVEDNSNALVR